MRTVRDDGGKRYLLLKESGESSLVRDPASGEERYLPNDRLESLEESPLVATARAALQGVPADLDDPTVPDSAREVLSATPSERALGLLLELDREPRSVRDLLGRHDLCESDLHGLLTAFRAAGLVAETDVGGERGYRTTGTASEGLAALG